MSLEGGAPHRIAPAPVGTSRRHPINPLDQALEAERRDAYPLALAMREEPLDLSGDHAERTADVVVNRLWISRLEFRPDPGARAAAEALVASDHRLDPYRRALLHYALGADVLTRPLLDLADVDAANEHLHRALALGRTLDEPRFAARCQAMLALLEVPRGNLTAAEDLCRDAMRADVERQDGAPAFWQVRALVVLQWARHYQGKQVDAAALRACTHRPHVWSDPVLAALLATVVALAALESGDVAEARRTLCRARGDQRITATGLWRLPLVLTQGHLAVTREDTLQAERAVAELERLPAPAEAALVRAAGHSHAGRVAAALAAVAPITSGELPALSFTYPVAATLEAALLEELGQHEQADLSMARALGASEPINALRVFTLQDPTHLLTLARRAAGAAPRSRWNASVVAYLASHVSAPTDQAYDDPVRTTLQESPAAGPATLPALDSGAFPLTARELDVLRLVNDGFGNAGIAAALFISVNTTKTHLRAIRRKLGVTRTPQAAALGRRAGWF